MSKSCVAFVIILLVAVAFLALDRMSVSGAACFRESLTTKEIVVESVSDDEEPAPLASTPVPIPRTPAPVPRTPAPVPRTQVPTPSKLASVANKPAPIPIDRSWCPKATCHSTVLCDTRQRRFLIILTLGRSASTTLTWTLNNLPGVRMSGEEQGLLNLLMDFETNSLRSPFKMTVPPNGRYGAFDHNPIPPGSLACASQKMVEAINPPCFEKCTETSKYVSRENEPLEIVGFKTIKVRNVAIPARQTAEYLTSHFPCTRFLINYSSNVTHQAESQTRAFRKTDAEAQKERIQSEAEYLMKVAKEIGDQAMVIDSAKWTINIAILNKAVEWLGFTDCAFPRPLELNTGATAGTGTSYSHSLKKIPMNPNCRYTGGSRIS